MSKSSLYSAKPLIIKWNKQKANAVVKFIAKLSNGKEHGIDKRIKYR